MAGIHRKYEIRRTDGSSEPGGQHEECAYFVLDLSCDEHAITALKAYARAVKKDNPALAVDLELIITTRPMRCGCREAYCPHTGLGYIPGDHDEMAHKLMVEAEDKKR